MQFTHKNLVLIAISALIVGGAFAFAEFRNKKIEKIVYTAPQVASAADALISDLQDIDADGDGLKDWEEVLIGSDPDKPDAEKARAQAAEKETVSEKNLTPSEKLARDFFARYMELNQAGLTNDPGSKTELITEVIKNGIVIQRPKAFTPEEIKTNPDVSAAALRFYGNQIGSIIKNNPHPPRDEAVITRESLEAEDPEILKEIDPIIANYKTILASLRNIVVPETLATIHLNLLNAVNKFVFVAESLRQTDVDTLKGIQGSANYLDAGDSLFSSLRALGDFFSTEKITFSPTEGGSIFTKKP